MAEPMPETTTAAETTGASRRVDGRPEGEADRRFFDLREAGYTGYTGWIDQDGNAVTDVRQWKRDVGWYAPVSRPRWRNIVALATVATLWLVIAIRNGEALSWTAAAAFTIAALSLLIGRYQTRPTRSPHVQVRFLRRTYVVVPRGDEAADLDVDGVVARILADR